MDQKERQRLKGRIIGAGYSVKDFSSKAGLNYQTVYAFLRGADVKSSTVFKILGTLEDMEA